MASISFKRSSLENFNKYNSLLVGNAFTPPPSASDFDLLETTILGSDAASVSFTSLNSTYGSDYKHLQLRTVARSNRASNADDFVLRINGITSTDYTRHVLFNDGSNVNSSSATSQTFITAGRISAANEDSNIFAPTVIDILDPFSASKNTTVRSLTGYAGASDFIYFQSGALFNTAAVTSITLFAKDGTNLIANSRFSLYGLKAGA